MLSLCTLASSSSGNATLICGRGTSLLIDAGISAKRITLGLAQLGLTPEDLDGICITHSHSDHTSGLRVFLKKTGAPIYATQGTADALRALLPEQAGRIRIVHPQEPFSVGSLTVNAFSTPHDAQGSVGYTVTDGERRCSVVTDLGYVTEEVRSSVLGSQLVLVEANHDPDWLKTGPYPPYLQQRILGDQGHLSNEDCGDFCCELAQHGAQKLILGHLSQENNTPEHAYLVVSSILQSRGFGEIPVTVASRSEYGAPVEV